MPAYVVRVSDNDNKQNMVPLTPTEDYKSLSKNQFYHFIKLYLKDNIMGFQQSTWVKQLSFQERQALNDFFEGIPDYLIRLRESVSKKLLMMHIVTNIECGFGYTLSELENDNIYRCLCRLEDICRQLDD